MMNYNELRKAYESQKKEIRQQIVAIIAQSPNPISAKEIANIIDNGVNAMNVGAFISSSTELKNAALQIGFEIRSKKECVLSRYVNIDNPQESITLAREVTKYYAYQIRKR